MKKYFIITILLFGVTIITLPHISHADNLWYGSITASSGDNVVLELRGLEQKNYFDCSIATLACSALAAAPIPIPSNNPYGGTPSPRSLIMFPRNTDRQNRSSDQKFGFYTAVNPAQKTRVLGFVTKSPKRTYTINDHLDFWNLFEEQPHISHFAPDNSTLTYLDDRSGFASLYLVNLKTISQKTVAGTKITSNVSVGDFHYADPTTILYVANTITDPYNWTLYSYNITTKDNHVLAQHLMYDTILYQSGNSIVFDQLNNFGEMPMVLTDYHRGEVKSFATSIAIPKSTNKITYTYQKIAGINTVTMSNRAIDAKVHPLIVWLHGGPYRQTSFVRHGYISYGVYDWVLEQAVNQGAYVVKIDYPGSYGAGRLFTESIKGGVGTTDVSAVENVINDFVAHNKVDGIYTVGNSYGGYLALKVATSYPTQINGVLSINGVTDWPLLLFFYQNSIFNTFFNGLPSPHNMKLFTKASIVNQLSNLQNPVYIIQGSVDGTVPPSQATYLKSKLDAAGKASNLIMIPDENHVFLKDSSINTICQTVFQMIHFQNSGVCNLNN